MCDFVDSMRSECLRCTGVLPDAWDGKLLPYKDGEFDMVVSFSVPLHVLPLNLRAVFAEHVRVARRWLFVATCTSAVPNRPGSSFVHDYEPLLAAFDLVELERRVFAGEQSGKKWVRTNWLFGVDGLLAAVLG